MRARRSIAAGVLTAAALSLTAAGFAIMGALDNASASDPTASNNPSASPPGVSRPVSPPVSQPVGTQGQQSDQPSQAPTPAPVQTAVPVTG
jgi:hypothetical protein